MHASKQFGLEMSLLISPDPSCLTDLEQTTYNVFCVPETPGSPYVPAQIGRLNGSVMDIEKQQRMANPPGALGELQTTVEVLFMPLVFSSAGQRLFEFAIRQNRRVPRLGGFFLARL